MFEFLFPPKDYKSILGKKAYFLLSKYKSCEYFYRYDDVKRWNELLNVKPSNVVKFFMYKKWIRKATIEEILTTYSVKELKDILKKNKLNTSGKKEKLIETIVTNNLLKLFKKDYGKYFILTEIGLDIVNDFEKQYKNDEINIINKLYKLLESTNISDAIFFASNYMSNRYFEYSDIQNWDKLNKEEKNHIIYYLKEIFKTNNQLFSNLSNDILKEIKIYTIIIYLLGYKFEKNPFNEKFNTLNFKYKIEDCFRLLSQYAYFKREIIEAKKEKDAFVVIVTSGCQIPCEIYNKLYKDKEFKISNIPEVPIIECPQEKGCSCWLRIKYI